MDTTKFVVYFTGEYDCDEWGYPVPSKRAFDTYEEALEAAKMHERFSLMPAPIEVETV